MYLKIGTINVSGWSEAKAIQLRQLIEHNNIDITIITETRRILDTSLGGVGRRIIVRGKGTKTTGVAFAAPQGKALTIVHMEDRIAKARHPSGITIIGAYAPTEQASEVVKADFWRLLKNQISRESATIIIGDLNAGQEEIRNPSAVSQGKTNYDSMAEMARELGLEIQDHGPTWISPYAAACNNKAPGRTLDRCLISSNHDYSCSISTDFTQRPADHALLLAKVHFLEVDRNKGRPFNTRLEGINETWYQARKQLLRNPPTQSQILTVNEFWHAKAQYEREQQDTLKILSQSNQQLTDEEAAHEVANYLASIWESGESLETERRNITEGILPTEEEIENAINKLKDNAAMGKDRISARSIKKQATAIRVYKNVFDKIWKDEKFPQQWKDLRIKPIPKKQNPAKCNEIRPIACVATSAKIANHIIIERTRESYENALHPSQHGYRQGRSCESAITQLLEATHQRGRKMVALLDMSKAYDSVLHTSLLRTLNRWKMPDKERNLILEQYQNCKVWVEINGYSAPPFNLRRGIRQGCSLSCMLFALVMSEVHYEVQLKLEGHNVEMISYSDDIVIAGPNILAVKVAIRYIEEALQIHGLAINDQKTKIVQFGNSSESFTWLGVHIQLDNGWNLEVRSRIAKMREAAEKIKMIKNSRRLNLRIKDKTHILHTMVGVYARLPNYLHATEVHQGEIRNELRRIILDQLGDNANNVEKLIKTLLGEHQEQNIGEAVSCEYCGKAFRNGAGLRQHHIFCKKHPDPPQGRKEECPHCKNSFYARAIRHHIRHCTTNRIIG